jgi:hypothetical protein
MSDDQRELVGRLFELVDAPFHGALRALLAENAALKANDPLAEITIEDITDEHVEAVEDLIGMGRGAWDMVKHRELLLACVQVIGKAKGVKR